MTESKPDGWGKPRKRSKKEARAEHEAARKGMEWFERALHGGKLRKDAMDGIDYVSTSLQELRIELALRLDDDFGLDQKKFDAFHTRSDAGADQIVAALQDAGRWSGYYTGTGQRWPGLTGFSSTVREKVSAAMAEYRALGDAVDYVEVHRRSCGNGSYRLPFDPDDPGHYRGVFGLVAGSPGTIHVLGSGGNVQRWLESQTHVRYRNRQCRWGMPQCLAYTAGQLMVFARGQFLVAVPTCYACAQRVTRGFTAVRTP
ncbi:hypothetical protein [Mycobacterium sp. SMC-17]|uniref:hypothetical protein n=1 Tax=Mycobacterium sp. SMC-17 TaxID=3381628 RepID=UPI003876F4A7